MVTSRVIVVTLVLMGSGLISTQAGADVRGVTTVSCWANNRVTETRLIGSEIGASAFEAFVDGLQATMHLVSLVGSAVSGNVFSAASEAYGSYAEVRELLDAVSDKTAAGFARHAVSRRCERVRIRFRFVSDDDPIGWVRAGVPGSEGFSQSGDFHERDVSREVKDTTVFVDIRGPAPGTYLVAFRGKETDCGTCLTILHVVELRFDPPPTAFLPLEPVSARQLRDSTTRREAAHLEWLAKWDDRAALIAGTRASRLMREWEQAEGVCVRTGWSANAPTPAYYECTQEAERQFQGDCPDLAFGIEGPTICNALQVVALRLDELQSRIENLDLAQRWILSRRRRQPS